MQSRGREIHISRHELTLLDRGLTDQVLGPAALMRRNDVFVAIKFLDGGLKMVEVPAAGIGFVAEHHSRPLSVAHRSGPAVRQKVDVHVVRTQQKRVESRVGESLFAVIAGDHIERFDHFDLPRFGP